MTTLETSGPAGAVELPVHLTPFVGRDEELADLAELVPSARLLTLTGAGGSGKTRLARETALRVASAYGRVAWADLAAIHDADLVAQEIASALHLPERPDESPRDVVVDAICEIRTLLVLDNCEHLVDACAELAESLLRACPRLTILATSREALGVTSEVSWLVPPLAATEATRLFVDRAQAALPTFTLNDTYLVYFAGWKNHIAFYGAPKGNQKFKEDLSSYESGAGTLQFPYDEPIPYNLITEIVKFRVEEIRKRTGKKKY